MRKRISSLLGLILAAGSCCTAAGASSDVNYDKLGQAAASALSDYIKIDTTNPPGNEEAGAKYLAGIFLSNGIDAQILPVVPGRSCVYARLKGTGKKKAIVLLNHIDVVPAQASDWKYPPFEGGIHDGELWGRGSLDMKNMAIIELEAMLQLKKSGVKLDRDIIFLATPDEEMGGEFAQAGSRKTILSLSKMLNSSSTRAWAWQPTIIRSLFTGVLTLRKNLCCGCGLQLRVTQDMLQCRYPTRHQTGWSGLSTV